VRAVRKVGSAVFSRAIALEYFIGLNPFQRVDIPRGEPVRERYALTPEQARGVLEHELWGRSPDVYRLAVRLGLLTGMNAAELVGLKREHVTPDCIQVRGQYYRGTWGGTKTANRRRDIPVTGAMRGVLGKLGFGGASCGDPVKAGWLEMPVFQSRAGTPISEHNVQRRYLKPIGDALGLSSFGWHILRHTFSSWCEDVGMLESDRQYLMGHAPATMTARYTHEDRRRMVTGLERVAAKLEEKPATGGKVLVMRRAV